MFTDSTSILVYRELTKNDFDGVKQLGLASFPMKYKDAYWLSVTADKEVYYSLGVFDANENLLGLVAVVPDMSKGPYSASSFSEQERRIVRVESGGYCLSQGTGLAKELMERAFRAVERKGSELTYLHVMASNTAAIRLYEKLSYTKEAEEPGYYALATKTEDGLLFVKRDINATLISWGNE